MICLILFKCDEHASRFIIYLFSNFFFILEESWLEWQAIFVIQIRRKEIALFFNDRSIENANRPAVRTVKIRQNSAIVR